MRKIYIILFFMSSFCTAQTLNFSIDTAVDTGTTITETLTDSGDTYVLTIDHIQDVEELDDLGGGDLIFYLGSGSSSTPFELTITKNGMPTNFNVTGIDYDTLGAGTIAVTNQNGDFISNPTAYPLGAGAITITNASNGLSITQINIIPNDTDDLNDFGFHNISVEILDTLSTEELSLEKNVEVLPNPSDGNITIKNSGVTLEKAVVTDLNGRIISTYNLEGIATDKVLDLSAILSEGLYLITISSESTSVTKKLTIKK